MSDCPKFVPIRDYYDVPRVQNGDFTMGSPRHEEGRNEDEDQKSEPIGPQRYPRECVGVVPGLVRPGIAGEEWTSKGRPLPRTW
jgi:hypothetical protein